MFPGSQIFPFFQCLIDNNFHNPNKNNAACIVNPDDCADGLSFSIFHYFTYDEEPEEFFNASKTFNKEYIVSSGKENADEDCSELSVICITCLNLLS